MHVDRTALLPGPFSIARVVEYEGPFRPPQEFIPQATPEAFALTRTASDPRFYDAASGRLIMAFHAILIETPRSKILVDTCIGNHKPRPHVAEWNMRTGRFLESLTALGAPPEQIDIVMCTHLHADHVGWNTRLENGRWVPTFPKARYLFGRTEFDYWQNLRKSTTPGANHYSWEDSIDPVIAAGQAELVDSHHVIEPGVSLVPAPGHTPGHVMVKLESGPDVAYVIGDVLHHPLHVERPAWSSKFCWDPVRAGQARSEILQTVAQEGAWLIPAHFPAPTAVRISAGTSGFKLSDWD